MLDVIPTKTKEDLVKFTCSKVNYLVVQHGRSKGSSVVQFTLTITFGADDCALTIRNCLAGIGKNGPWAMPPQHKFKPVVWNRAFELRLIQGFQEAGTFDQLGPSTWAEEQDVTVEF